MRSSDGLKQLLLRHGYKPTGDSKKDIKTAKRFMPPGYMEKNYDYR